MEFSGKQSRVANRDFSQYSREVILLSLRSAVQQSSYKGSMFRLLWPCTFDEVRAEIADNKGDMRFFVGSSIVNVSSPKDINMRRLERDLGKNVVDKALDLAPKICSSVEAQDIDPTMGVGAEVAVKKGWSLNFGLPSLFPQFAPA